MTMMDSMTSSTNRRSEDRGVSLMQAITEALPTDRYHGREDVLEALDTLLDNAGARHWLLLGLPLPLAEAAHHVVHARWPDALLHKLQREAPASRDPFCRAAIGSRECVREQDLAALLHQAPEVAQTLQDYGAHGLSHLVAVPCIKVGRYQMVLLIAFGRAVSDDDLALIAATAKRLADRLHAVVPETLPRGPQLTSRERQIVALTAEGLTSNEIAALLGISARTVFAHLTSAGDKLKAANKTGTVVNAFRYGQISL